MTFLERASEMQHRIPITPLERILKAYAWANSGQVLDIVVDNWKTLRDADLLEAAFLQAWSHNKHGVPNWTLRFCHAWFALLDQQKLLAASDPLPDGETFTVYRGVAGIGTKRRVRGYSWTIDESVARFFAQLRSERYRLPNPAVYRGTVERKHVLAYLNESGRNEREFLICPVRVSHLKRFQS